MKSYEIKSKTGDKLTLRVELVGRGKALDILFRITRGEDYLTAQPHQVVLWKEEAEEIAKLLTEKLLDAETLKKEFPERVAKMVF